MEDIGEEFEYIVSWKGSISKLTFYFKYVCNLNYNQEKNRFSNGKKGALVSFAELLSSYLLNWPVRFEGSLNLRAHNTVLQSRYTYILKGENIRESEENSLPSDL